jgi:hypothetical protein
MILSTHGIVGSQIVQFSAAAFESAFNDRVVAAGGSLSTTERNALVTLINDLNNYGIWTKMKAIYPMVGASAAACAQNLKSSSFTGTFTATGWTFASTGVTPNGSSAYFDTTINILNDLSQNNTHVSVYLRTNADNSNAAFGGGKASFNNSIMLFPKAGGASYANMFVNGASNTASVSDSLGFYQVTRSISNSYNLFKNTTKSTFNTTSVIGTNASLFISAFNQEGTIFRYDNRQNAFASIGDGLTDTEASNFYTAVQAFQTTLSRQV